MSRDWLLLRLEAPLMAFGGEAVDQVGPTRDFPAASMLVGLLANALGWRWEERDRHDRLQARLVFGAVLLREGRRITDVQNARLDGSDRGWTTSGRAEGRAGGSYGAPHRRRRDYIADAAVLVALRLDPEVEEPGLHEIEEALDRPARPLFLGRKPCLPTRPLLDGRMVAPDAHAALLLRAGAGLRATWPAGEGPDGSRSLDLADLRQWRTGLHGGARRAVEGRLA